MASFDHRSNAYQHSASGNPVSAKTTGLHIFMSAQIQTWSCRLQGISGLEPTGENKGKILEEDGSKPLDLSITKNIAAMFFGIALIFLDISFDRQGCTVKIRSVRPAACNRLLNPLSLFFATMSSNPPSVPSMSGTCRICSPCSFSSGSTTCWD